MGKTELYALLPVFNKSVSIDAPLPLVLSDDLILRNIEDGEKRLIAEGNSSAFSPDDITNEVFVISLSGVRDDTEKNRQALEETVRLDALSVQTIFNIVGVKGVMSIPYGVIVERGAVSKVKYMYDLEMDYLSMRYEAYELLPNITVAEVKRLIFVTRKILKNDKPLQITFKRFCSSYLKKNTEDRLIDLTIALESLIPASTEISFQFSLYLSLLIAQDHEGREEVFYKLKDLYNARSGIVHGSSDRDVKKSINNAMSNWDELLDYVKRCIFYRLAFKESNPDGDWKMHLLSLGLGKTTTD